ncbi:MerR family transcriptional regulator [Janibacter alkaliphilus]|uniref:DNA-binding transcriptional MerR regulator n=1 Tax=Janibacter alkaliphilus TaxID=1069963 RepID=A0A852X509_9MICO|nr:MerR family transcriptional regulator [Janibacter alkaliphilus]NYG37999.1 DNA-binding transcriptional MerR regulator [Janibacter alkaliphilus]
MAELAARSGLTVATIKFYLREGLLQPGRRTSVNQAVYDASHLERLRLIRALAKVAGLPLDTIREVVQVVSGQSSILDAMAVTQDALVGERGDEDSEDVEPAAAETLAHVIEARGWRYQPGSPAHSAAIRAVAELQAEDLTMLVDRLDDYARAADAVGRIDVQAVAGADSLDATIRGVVLGSILRRPLLDALVLLSQQHHANVLDQEDEHA